MAILPVVLHHAGVPGLPGGFTGVDVFFVISGYLITANILWSMRAGQFSIAAFYERRARRILPALFVMLGASTLAAWWLFTPDDFRLFLQALAATALFGSNLLFARGTDYFSTGEGFSPLIHGWSLGVEEQFYLLFPALLLALWKWWPRAIPAMVAAGLVASFVLATTAAPHHPLLSFYLLPTRLWELLAGSACALLPIATGRHHHGWAGLAGLALIGAGYLAIGADTPAPGPAFLLPVAGAALVILFARPGTVAARLLSSRGPVLIGIASYGTYLWHQPLLAFFDYAWFGPVPPMGTAAAVAASLALGWASFRLVETPVRQRRVLPRRITLAMACIAAIGLCTVAGVAGHQRQFGPHSLALATAMDGRPPAVIEQPVIIPPTAPLPFILYGDSHAQQYHAAMVERFGPGALISETACLAAPGATNIPGDFAKAHACNALPAQVAALAHARGANRVVWAQRWDRELFDPVTGDSLGVTSGDGATALTRAVGRMLATLPADAELVLVGNSPTAWAAGNQMEGGWLRCRAYANAACPASFPAGQAEGRAVNAMLHAYAEGHPRVIYVDPAVPLCPDGRCRIIADGHLLYWDGSHLTLRGARAVAALLPPAHPRHAVGQ